MNKVLIAAVGGVVAGALIVTQDRVPVGLVHVLDLLRIGAA